MSNLDFNEALEKLGIKKMISRFENAESSDILFSKFDTCSISGFEYHDGNKFEVQRYNREVSCGFSIIWEYLKSLGYNIDMEYYGSDRRSNLDCDYKFIGKGLPGLTINFNKFHTHLYKIYISYTIHDSGFYDIKNHKKDILKSLKFYAERNSDVSLLRTLRLNSLLK